MMTPGFWDYKSFVGKRKALVKRPTPNETYLPISFTIAEEPSIRSPFVGS